MSIVLTPPPPTPVLWESKAAVCISSGFASFQPPLLATDVCSPRGPKAVFHLLDIIPPHDSPLRYQHLPCFGDPRIHPPLLDTFSSSRALEASQQSPFVRTRFFDVRRRPVGCLNHRSNFLSISFLRWFDTFNSPYPTAEIICIFAGHM